MRKHRLSLAFLFIHTITWTLQGQLDISRFTKYTSLDGLVHNHVTCITQDSIGYIWIGTENGPMRFDGTTFVALTSLNPSYSDKEPFTVKFTTLGDDELGIATLYGAHVINTHSYELTTLDFEVEEDLTTWAYNTFDVARDHHHHYAVSTKTGFYIFDPGKKLLTSKHVFTVHDIGTSWMLYGREMTLAPNGMIIQKNDKGFNLFNSHTRTIDENPPFYQLNNDVIRDDAEIHFTFIDSAALLYYSPLKGNIYLHDLQLNTITAISIPAAMKQNLNWFSRMVIQNDSTLLINGRNGLYKVQYNALQKQVRIDPKLYFPDMVLSALYVDRDGRLWIGTYAGLYKENAPLPVEKFPVTAAGKGKSIQIKWMEKIDSVWYASTLKDGILILDKNNYQILKQHSFTYDQQPLKLGKMIRYDADHLWSCSDRGIVEYNIKSGEYKILSFQNHPEYLDSNSIHELYRDQQGYVWAASNEGNTAYKIDAHRRIERIAYSEDNPLFKVNIVYRFNEDGKGNIWFCGDAMARYNPTLNRIDSLIEKLPLQHNSRKVFLLYRNSQNHLWMATNGENWHIYTDADGFSIYEDARLSPDLNKYHVIIDDLLLYISRQGKIVILNTITRKARVLSAVDGWDQEMLGSYGFFKDKQSGYIVFAGDNTIYRFKPEPGEPRQRHELFISEVNVFGKRLIHHPADNLRFDADEHTMLIKFPTLNFNDPQNQVFEYRLRGSNESTWITVDKPEIILNQIPSGQYDLELRVSSKNNDWAPALKTYPLLIRFPFYLQPWFVVLLAGSLAVLIWLVVRYRLKQMRFISNLDRQVIEYELKALHAQMNPHFVFNCLNSIKEMIMSKDNKNANIYLNKFSFLLRSTLDQSKLPFVPLAHTIEYLRHYLEMEKLRFTRFQYAIEVQEGLETDSTVMAPLLLQPIVENAIWHGQDRDRDTNQLNIRFYSLEEDLVCEVEDFGVGINAAKKVESNGTHMSSALENIRKRIELLNRKHDVDYRLVLEDKSDLGKGQGTIVKLMFKHKQYEFD